MTPECKTGRNLAIFSSSYPSWVFEEGFSSEWLSPPLANWENNREAIAERQEGKKGMSCWIYTSRVPFAPEAFQGLLTWELSISTAFAWNSLWWDHPAAKALGHNMYWYSQLGTAQWLRKSFRSQKGVIFLIFASLGVRMSGIVSRHPICNDNLRGAWHSKESHSPNVLYMLISQWLEST